MRKRTWTKKPSIIHSEKGNGFHDFYKEQCKKIEYSINRVQIVSTPFKISQEFVDNYDDINWDNKKK